MSKKILKTPIVGIYFSDPNPMGSPFSKPTFVEAYTEIINYLKSRGVKAVVVRGDTYRGHGVFKRYFRWSENNRAYVKVNKPIAVDLIWNRDSENKISKITDCPMFNDLELDNLCRDKYASYEAFKEFSGKTFLVNTYKEAAKVVKQNFKDSKLIMKPRFGERSEGVNLIKDTDLHELLYADWKNIIIQEFLDPTGGVPGFTEGAHELKVWLVNNKFAGSRVKQLPPGEFISNAGGIVGGQHQVLSYQDLDSNLIEKVELIKKYLEEYPISLIRADFINVFGEYKLVEINSRPGLANTEYDGTDFYWKIGVQITDAIVEYFEKTRNENITLPLIVAAPHARTTVPEKMRSRIRLSDYEIWRMGDPFTASTSYHSSAYAHLKGDANRILCDLSQGIDPKLKFRKQDFYGNDIFVDGKEFTKQERLDFLEKYSKRYRHRIVESIKKLAKNGATEILFVDHHNTASEHPVHKSGSYMPAITVSNGGKRHSGSKQIIEPEHLSCPPEFLHTFKEKFDHLMDFTAEINHIYKISHTIKWIIEDVAPLYPDIKIHCLFIEYDLNLIHNPITKSNDHLAKAMLRDAVNQSIDEVFKAHFKQPFKVK